MNAKMSKQRFLIENVIIDKFRGFNERKEFRLFPNNPDKRGIILLSGPNGFGKSSFIDAIEWCLTGKIKRLEEQFNKRNENTLEKQKGLIRNTITNGSVSVEIQGAFGDQKISIYREYTGNKDYDDGFFCKQTKLIVTYNNNVVIDSSKDSTAIVDNLPFINYNISKCFYDRFVCSQEKTIHIYEKGRGDFYEMFSLFLGGTDEIEKIENSIEGYFIEKGKKKEKITGLLEQIKVEKEALSTEIRQKDGEIENYITQLSKFNEGLKSALSLDEILNSYPDLLFYKGERLISQLYKDIEENKVESQVLTIQKNVLTNIGKAKEKQNLYYKVTDVIGYLENNDKYNDFNTRLYIPYKDKAGYVKLCRELDFDVICKHKETLQNQKINMEQNDLNYDEMLLLLHERIGTLYKTNTEEYNSKKLQYEQVQLKLIEFKGLHTQLSSYDKTDIVVNALESILDHLDGFKKYREQSEECPLCHSKENFSKEGFELGENARQALVQYDEGRTILKDRVRKVQENIEEEILKMCIAINGVIEFEVDSIELQIVAYNATQDIRYACIKYGLDFMQLSEKLLENKLNELQSKVATAEEYALKEKDLLRSLLNSDGILSDIPSRMNSQYNATIDEFNKWSDREKLDILKNYISTSILKENEYELLMNINDIQEELLKVKIYIITKIKDIVEGQAEIKNIKTLIQKCDREIKQKKEILSEKGTIEAKIEEIRTSIKKVRGSVDRGILDNLNVPLNYIFKRINRHNIYDNIELSKPKRGVAKNAEFNISNIFGQSTFIPNVVSTGQLSSITLSIFLTVAMGQRHLPFRCYFMDDPIQSMDDINILSFIDLLRTELGPNIDEEKRFADQLYISTCNEDMEALIKHKAKHFGIGLSSFKFNGYGSFIGG